MPVGFCPGRSSSIVEAALCHYCHPLPAQRSPWLTTQDIGILADIDHSVQNFARGLAIRAGQGTWLMLLTYDGGFVGQGDDGVGVGAAVIGAGAGAAAAFGRVGFFAAGLAGFFAVDGDAGDNSTTTGLGRSLGGSSVDVIASSFSVVGVILTREGLSPLDCGRTRDLVGGGAKAMIARGTRSRRASLSAGQNSKNCLPISSHTIANT